MTNWADATQIGEFSLFVVPYERGDGLPAPLGSPYDGTRPEADTAYVLRWPLAGIDIPWPVGLSAKQAILKWATQYEDSRRL